MASLSVIEWVHDHVEMQLLLLIYIPVVRHLRDVCLSFCRLLTAFKSYHCPFHCKEVNFFVEFSLNCAQRFSKAIWNSLLTAGWNRSVSLCPWPRNMGWLPDIHETRWRLGWSRHSLCSSQFLWNVHSCGQQSTQWCSHQATLSCGRKQATSTGTYSWGTLCQSSTHTR